MEQRNLGRERQFEKQSRVLKENQQLGEETLENENGVWLTVMKKGIWSRRLNRLRAKRAELDQKKASVFTK
ncbi:hypothetical protein ACLOJK_007067 [Asimina triloba]